MSEIRLRALEDDVDPKVSLLGETQTFQTEACQRDPEMSVQPDELSKE